MTSVVSSISHCVCVHNYQGNRGDELTLHPGEVVKVSKKADDGWWYGHKVQPLDEKKGWFPSNFAVEPEGLVINAQGPLRHARVAYEYKSQEADEMDLYVGDMITVILSDEDEGWYRGVCNGKLGLFPANFVVMLPKNDQEKLTTAKKEDSPKNSVIKPNEIIKNSIKMKEPDRRSSLALFGEQAQNVQNQMQQFQAIPEKDTRKVLSKAVVTFDYVAQQPDELNLKKGMVLDIVAKDEEGWWTGITESGNEGVFPFNFVKEIQENSAAVATSTSPDKNSEKPLPNIEEKPFSPGVPSQSKPVATRKISSGMPKPTMDTTVPPVISLMKPSMIKQKESEFAFKPHHILKPVLGRSASNSSEVQAGNSSPAPAPATVFPKPPGMLSKKPILQSPPQTLTPKSSNDSVTEDAKSDRKNLPEAADSTKTEKTESSPAGSTSNIAPVGITTQEKVPLPGFGVINLFKKLGGSLSSVDSEQPKEAPKLTHITKSRPNMSKKRPPSNIASKVLKIADEPESRSSTITADKEEASSVKSNAQAIPEPGSHFEAVSTATTTSADIDLDKTLTLDQQLKDIIASSSLTKDSNDFLNSTAVSGPPPLPGNKPKQSNDNSASSTASNPKTKSDALPKIKEEFSEIRDQPSKKENGSISSSSSGDSAPTAVPRSNPSVVVKQSTEPKIKIPMKTSILGPILLPAYPTKDYTTVELYKIFYDEMLRFREELNEKLKDYDQLKQEVADLRKQLEKKK